MYFSVMLLVPRVTKQISLYYYNDNKVFYSILLFYNAIRARSSTEELNHSGLYK